MSKISTGLLRVLFFILIPVGLATSVGFFLVRALVLPMDAGNSESIAVEIPVGSSFGEVVRLIEEKGVVRHGQSLKLLARLKGSPTDHILAGEYLLSPSMEPREVLAKLLSGDVLKRVVTFKEGMSVTELGRLVEDAGLLSKAEIDAAIVNMRLLAAAGISGASFEGYLFPETYIFSRPVSAKDIIWKMLEEAEGRWTEEFGKQADALALSRPEVLTLASIIEKESGQKIDQQPLISSVFHNRLKLGMKLESDPTVLYGLTPTEQNMPWDQKKKLPSPYNTYVHFNLPPGPICNPGATAIKAALFPAESNYLFFVADGTGGHTFSATLAEHNAAVAKYLLAAP